VGHNEDPSHVSTFAVPFYIVGLALNDWHQRKGKWLLGHGFPKRSISESLFQSSTFVLTGDDISPCLFEQKVP